MKGRDGSDEHCVHGQGHVHCTPQASNPSEKSVPPIETQARASQQEKEGNHQAAGDHVNESIERVLQSSNNVRVWAAHTHRTSLKPVKPEVPKSVIKKWSRWENTQNHGKLEKTAIQP